MTLLWHRLRALWLACGVATAAFAAVAAAGIMVEEVARFASVSEDHRLSLAARWFVVTALESVPHVVSTSLPVSCAFVAVVWARKGELLAAAQLGEPPWRLRGTVALAYLLPAALLWGSAASVQPRILAWRNQLAEQKLAGGDALSRRWIEPPSWFRAGEQIVYLPAQARAAACADGSGASCFSRPIVYRWRRGRIESVTTARALAADGHAMVLLDARTHRLDRADLRVTARLPLPAGALPHALSELVGQPQELSARALDALIARRRRAGLPVAAHVWDAASRRLRPLGLWALVVALAPAVLTVHRRRTLGTNVGLAAAAAAVQAACEQVAHGLFAAALLPAMAAAALPALWWLALAAIPCVRDARPRRTPRR